MPYHLEALLTGLGSGSTTFYLAFEVIGTNGDLYVDGADITAGGPLLITVTGA
jgi:ribose 5-phosphate isomerase